MNPAAANGDASLDAAVARRVEAAEAEMMAALADAVRLSGRQPGAFARPCGGGVATYVRPGSPLNKVLGVGLTGLPDRPELAAVHAAFREVGEPTRIELATVAPPAVCELLADEGFRLVGFENVLVRDLSADDRASPVGISVARAHGARECEQWRTTIVEAFAAQDGTGTPVDALTRDAIVDAVGDFLACEPFDRFTAFVDGKPAGAADLRVRGDVALFSGAGTLSAFRGRGVHAALTTARLEHARRAGATLAAITTAPGSRSQHNAAKRGFALAYARAILVRS